MNVVLVDAEERDHLLPLTFTRPVADLRIGIFTIAEKWKKLAQTNVFYQTQDYLSRVFPKSDLPVNLFVNGALIPTPGLVNEINELKEGDSLFHDETWIASNLSGNSIDFKAQKGAQVKSPCRVISRSWQIFQWNEWALEQDMIWIRANGTSAPIPEWVTLIGEDIYVEQGAQLMPSIINTKTGPVYIGKHAEVMEGAMIRGSLALLDHAVIKMGAKIYGSSTFGPECRVGGEVNNAIMLGYSNKGHDGFIGNTVIGEWCNLGADTNTSNLKNNYADVKIHNYALNRSESTGGQFCGLIMGDHAKSGINTMFNTGTICGIFANVFDSGFPHRRIPDFGWGGATGFKKYRIEDALEVAERMMERRHVTLTDDWKNVYRHLFEKLASTIA